VQQPPRGYVGKQHETIGSDLLSILKALRDPEKVIGPDAMQQLQTVDPTEWYPVELLLGLLERIHDVVGPEGVRNTGRVLFSISHEARIKNVARSARDIVFGLDDMYHHANRGIEIGGWKVLSFEPGRAMLEKTTPHLCLLEEGILETALRAVEAPSQIEQSRCLRDGADACVFVIASTITDERWSG
jgi:hypothetical protein